MTVLMVLGFAGLLGAPTEVCAAELEPAAILELVRAERRERDELEKKLYQKAAKDTGTDATTKVKKIEGELKAHFQAFVDDLDISAGTWARTIRFADSDLKTKNTGAQLAQYWPAKYGPAGKQASVQTLWPAVRDLNDDAVFIYFSSIYFDALPNVDPRVTISARPLDASETARVAEWAAALLTGTGKVDLVPLKKIFAATSTDPAALGDILRKYGDKNVLDGLERNPMLWSDPRVRGALLDTDEDLYSRPFKFKLILGLWYSSEDRETWRKEAAATLRRMADATEARMPLHGQLLQMAADLEQLSLKQMDAGLHARLDAPALSPPY